MFFGTIRQNVSVSHISDIIHTRAKQVKFVVTIKEWAALFTLGRGILV